MILAMSLLATQTNAYPNGKHNDSSFDTDSAPIAVAYLTKSRILSNHYRTATELSKALPDHVIQGSRSAHSDGCSATTMENNIRSRYQSPFTYQMEKYNCQANNTGLNRCETRQLAPVKSTTEKARTLYWNKSKYRLTIPLATSNNAAPFYLESHQNTTASKHSAPRRASNTTMMIMIQ